MGKVRSPAQKGPSPALVLIVVGIVLVGLVVLVIALGTRQQTQTSSTPAVTGAPSAAVEVDTVDHGTVRFGQQVESAFVIRNVGDEPLRILQTPRVELVEGC